MQIITLTTMSAKKRCEGFPRIESKDYIYIMILISDNKTKEERKKRSETDIIKYSQYNINQEYINTHQVIIVMIVVASYLLLPSDASAVPERACNS